jgi:tRNA A-37 threonylcarbamoyl transferase component Bud32
VRELDAQINGDRLGHEARCMSRASLAGVQCPALLFVDRAKLQLWMT